MQAAKYWRNRQLRYRLKRALPKPAPVVEMPRLLRSDAAAQPPKAKLTLAS